MKESCFLTNGGNILRQNQFSQSYFQTIAGQFIRQLVEPEAAYLRSVCLPAEIEFSGEFESMPVWRFMWETEDADLSNHIDNLSDNGGAYGTYTTAKYCAAQMPNGEWKFRVLTIISNRNDFSQTDDGRYTQEIAYVWIKNIYGGEFGVCVQGREDMEDVIERYSEEVTIEAALRDAGRYTSPVSDGYGEYDDRSQEERTTVYSVTFAQLKERILKLKEIGIARDKQIGGMRGRQYRSINRR